MDGYGGDGVREAGVNPSRYHGPHSTRLNSVLGDHHPRFTFTFKSPLTLTGVYSNTVQ